MSVVAGTARAANAVIDAIRRHVAVRDEILRAAKGRRDLVRELANEHPAARAGFNSGSVAHATANAPLNDTDCGVVLDRRRFWAYGPDGGGEPPGPLLDSFRDWIFSQLRTHYPKVTCEITKRALLFEFHDALTFEGGIEVDPSVDLIIGLDRRDAPGLWIPNTERPGWDPSDPQYHTALFLDTEQDLRVHRARVVRLAKVAVKNDGDYKVMCSFNIEALALELVTETGSIAAALATFLIDVAAEIAVELTDDPAGVSGRIKLPDGITQVRAAERLQQLGQIVQASLDAQSEAEARRVLAAVFGPQIEEMREHEAESVDARMRRGLSAVAAPLLSNAYRPGRSDGV
jgi:hypothetical protein